jgi:uncharacterized linocin/CFP29 family protein
MATVDLGRDKVWSAEIWAAIDEAVQSELGRIRVAQKVFPTVPLLGAQYVADEQLDTQKMTLSEGATKPFMELSKSFTLTQAQVGSENALRSAQTLARYAAKCIAIDEDQIIFNGTQGQTRGRLRISSGAPASAGLLGLVDPKANVSISVGGTSTTYPKAILDAVNQGRTMLVTATHPGPYALILSTKLYGEACSTINNSLTTVLDLLAPQLTGGLYASNALSDETGLLVSLGGEPVTLYAAQDAIVAFTNKNNDGDYRFRVFEQIQFVVRDKTALVLLDIQP